MTKNPDLILLSNLWRVSWILRFNKFLSTAFGATFFETTTANLLAPDALSLLTFAEKLPELKTLPAREADWNREVVILFDRGNILKV